MAVNKVVFGTETLIDLTGDTVAPEVLLAGYTATNAAGVQIEGSMDLSGYATTDYVDTELAKKQNKVTYGTSDLTAGSSALATGDIYFVYE